MYNNKNYIYIYQINNINACDYKDINIQISSLRCNIYIIYIIFFKSENVYRATYTLFTIICFVVYSCTKQITMFMNVHLASITLLK